MFKSCREENSLSVKVLTASHCTDIQCTIKVPAAELITQRNCGHRGLLNTKA